MLIGLIQKRRVFIEKALPFPSFQATCLLKWRQDRHVTHQIPFPFTLGEEARGMVAKRQA